MAGHSQSMDPDAAPVYIQYEDIDQQQESYIVGMWAFLVTEIMFFGALFLIYILYRWNYQTDFYLVHKQLDWVLGGVNTLNLLVSSFFMALAVHFAQKKQTKPQLAMLGLTLVCAFIFLVIKYFEYSSKISHGLFPNANFSYGMVPGQLGDPEHARLFLSLYFAMTGLHGIHVIVGIIIISALMIFTVRKAPTITDYIPTEMVGLYWHFVDLVWIFLYPLFYLIPK